MKWLQLRIHKLNRKSFQAWLFYLPPLWSQIYYLFYFLSSFLHVKITFEKGRKKKRKEKKHLLGNTGNEL